MIYPKIKEKMKEYDLHVEDVAVWLKVSPQVVYDRLNGRSKFRPLECDSLSLFLHTPTEELFEEVQDV